MTAARVSNLTVELGNNWINCSREFAERVVADYASGRKSRELTCFDAHENVTLQANAKMCECAFAVAVGLNPGTAVDWTRRTDNGSDIRWRGKRWDIKATRLNSHYLIWPIAKNSIYHSKQFDCLALVKFAVPTFELAGWMSKGEFSKTHEVASEGHKLFPGTWYVHEDRLWDLTTLMEA